MPEHDIPALYNGIRHINSLHISIFMLREEMMVGGERGEREKNEAINIDVFLRHP